MVVNDSLQESVKDVFLTFLENIGRAVWVEIVTEDPQCTYYFGPFVGEPEAREATIGYVEDLKSEGAVGIDVRSIKRMRTPAVLTIFDE
ncbi:MAG: DUF1816 domain-containing protein [Pseudanabaenaceae cyanobacterium SKYGB_i_bin29]|nr:DUF1816 domain-containing protein [Pseudanabaenaceae cyanobacterium SKYG29]MDW8421023.1 DUF1816 domain-containing protein [Pseudanabaenaceae cyanobacterium SKYGB_i_bin29]